ncbi:MAG: hypothetical protein ACREMA_00210 [Longimicrobiales bacterium]
MSVINLEVTDKNSAKILIRMELPDFGKARWEVVNHKFLRRQKGVVDKGDRGSGQTYVGLYGSSQVDDKYLVMHLDDFMGDGGTNTSGTGTLYNHDNWLMVPGPLTWKIT